MIRFGKDWAHLALFLFFAALLPLHAGTNGKTNETGLSYTPRLIELEPSERSDIFMDRFFEELIASDGYVFDRFSGPSSRLGWARKQNALGYGILDRFNSSGASMFATISLDSLRTTALELLPLGLWEDYWQKQLAYFITGTVGNPQEEHIQITSISYSAIRSSWEKGNERARIRWGLRPWRTNPYLYLLAHAGRLDGRPLATFEGRAGYTLFGSAKLEGRLTFQLPASFRIAGAASVDPTRLGSHDPSYYAVTLERVVRSHALIPDSVFYLGFRSGANATTSPGRRDNMIVAGLSGAW